MKDAGLVNGRREGRCVYYRVEPRGMKPLIDWIAHYRAFWTEHVDRLNNCWRRWTNDDDKTARSQTESISFEFDLHHSPEKVWRALTDPGCSRSGW